MANYVDGFVVPVPRKKIEAYRSMARKSGKIWREHGALAYRECIADDVKWGKRTSFPRSVKLKPGEVVWFSWIVYKSRKHRDRENQTTSPGLSLTLRGNEVRLPHLTSSAMHSRYASAPCSRQILPDLRAMLR